MMLNLVMLGLLCILHTTVLAASLETPFSVNAATQFTGVKRNHEVLAIAKTENIEIQRPMRALSYGRVGQTIRVLDPNTQVIHQALVLSNKVVQLQWKGLTSQ